MLVTLGVHMEHEKEILRLLQQIYDLVSKTELWNHPLIIAAVPAIIAIGGFIVGAVLQYRLGIKSQQKINNLQLRQKTFGELIGLKFLTAQLYVSCFEALIYSDFHEQKCKLAGSPKDSLDMQEEKRWRYKNEEMILKIAENNNKLFNIIGIIHTLYPSTPEFKKLIAKIYNFKTPKIMVDAHEIKTEDLENWKKQAVSDLQKVVEKEYSTPINNLIGYLFNKINS